jgi:hypothetical protein
VRLCRGHRTPTKLLAQEACDPSVNAGFSSAMPRRLAPFGARLTGSPFTACVPPAPRKTLPPSAEAVQSELLPTLALCRMNS